MAKIKKTVSVIIDRVLKLTANLAVIFWSFFF